MKSASLSDPHLFDLEFGASGAVSGVGQFSTFPASDRLRVHVRSSGWLNCSVASGVGQFSDSRAKFRPCLLPVALPGRRPSCALAVLHASDGEDE
jgi:hypothetical protein